ncbi:MAG: hypothetical protein IPL71_20680 [Anaerolineales bacterium]|uniref:hypothetical protein n=1 Tax=Candidatus Villigracilis proximus TaxID=3140683 RepID=UPI003134F54F|nr:hypothetical protein [Anaerolineales bacterium]
MLVHNIHVGFFSYGYKLLQPAQSVENISFAAPLDIGLMKLDALIGRGSRKDFYDVYVISQHIPLVDLLEAGRKKYPQLRDFAIMAIESRCFENGERDIQPAMFIGLSWDELKNTLLNKQKHWGINGLITNTSADKIFSRRFLLCQFELFGWKLLFASSISPPKGYVSSARSKLSTPMPIGDHS